MLKYTCYLEKVHLLVKLSNIHDLTLLKKKKTLLCEIFAHVLLEEYELAILR